MQYATACERLLITENRPDFINLHCTVPHHAGIIIFKHDRDYRHTIESTHSAFNHQYADVPAYDLTDLPSPGNDFEMSGIDSLPLLSSLRCSLRLVDSRSRTT